MSETMLCSQRFLFVSSYLSKVYCVIAAYTPVFLSFCFSFAICIETFYICTPLKMSPCGF
jgi:hypothetical protein